VVCKLLIPAAVALGLAAPAAAVTNIGFEAGDLSGWTVSNGSVAAVTSFGAYTPQEGSWFARLTTNGTANLYTLLTQTVTLAAGQTLQGVFGFQTTDYLPYNDDGFFRINGTPIVTASVSSVGNFGSSGWLPWSFTAPAAGSYTLQVGVRNLIDGEYPSHVLFDAKLVAAAVPEPATWALMLAGFGLVGLGARRQRNRVIA
jgi:hypothetical protein